MKSERFEFEHIVIDVVEEVKQENTPIIHEGDIGLLWMKPDTGNGTHDVIDFQKFYDYETLMVAKKGLELLQMAEARNEDEATTEIKKDE